MADEDKTTDAGAGAGASAIDAYLRSRLDAFDGVLRKTRSDSFTNAVAICVAIVSAFLAVIAIKNGNVAQANSSIQREVANYWNQYQAKRLRQFVLDASIGEMDANYAGTRRADMSPALANQFKAWKEERNRYAVELRELASNARAQERSGEKRIILGNQLDIAEAFLALSLALFAVAALTKLGWMLALALGVGGTGVFFGIAAFAEASWALPEFLVRLFQG